MALTNLTKPRARWQTFKLKVAEAVSRSLYDKLIERGVTPRDFGAKGDGVADDTDAIQAALDFPLNNNVYLGVGRYRITKTLHINNKYQRFRGAGRTAVIVADNVQGAALMTYSGSGEPTNTALDIGDFTVVGSAKCAVAFVHLVTSTASNIYLEYTSGDKFTGDYGFVFEYGWGNTFKNLYTNGSSCSFASFKVNAVVLATTFENMYTSDFASYNFYIDSTRKEFSTGSGVGFGRLKFINPVVQGARSNGIYVRGSNVFFDNLYFENVLNAIHVDKGSTNIIFENGLVGAGASGLTSDYLVYIGNRNTSDTHVVGQVFFNNIWFSPSTLPIILADRIWSTGVGFRDCMRTGTPDSVDVILRRTPETSTDYPCSVSHVNGGGSAFSNPLMTVKSNGYGWEMVRLRPAADGTFTHEQLIPPEITTAPNSVPHP